MKARLFQNYPNLFGDFVELTMLLGHEGLKLLQAIQVLLRAIQVLLVTLNKASWA